MVGVLEEIAEDIAYERRRRTSTQARIRTQKKPPPNYTAAYRKKGGTRNPSLAVWHITNNMENRPDVLNLEEDQLTPFTAEIEDILLDGSTPDPVEYAARADLIERVRAAMSRLTEREQRLLKMRYGFYDGDTRTFEEIAKQFGITGARVRQLELKALQKLRSARAGLHGLGIWT